VKRPFALLLFTIAACHRRDDDEQPGKQVPPSTIPVTTGPVSTTELLATLDALYDPDHVVDVEITLDPADLLELTGQTRAILDLVTGADCLDHPFADPFTWFEADVTVDGTLLPRSGLSKKGLIGSLSTTKPSLKLDFDRFVPGQGYGGLGRMTLNNSISDPSLVKQCLGYGLFRDAGMPASRCNFAHVTVNGTDLGVYVDVETVKSDFLDDQYGAEDDGDLYEGSLSDFRDGWLGTFEPKTDDTNAAMPALLDVEYALAIDDDDLMLQALQARIDLDEFADFWAMEVLIAQIDGYTANANNFFVYRVEDGDRLDFIPWGIDATFLDVTPYGDSPLVFDASALPNRLWSIPAEQARYLSHLQALLDSTWDEPALQAEIDRMSALIEPFALPDPGRSPAQDAVRSFVATRRDTIEAALAEVLPESPPLRSTPCIVEKGSLSLDFATTYGTLYAADPLAQGSSTFSATVDGAPIGWSGAAVAGDSNGTTLIAGLGFPSAGTLEEAVVVLPTWALAPGTFAVDNFTSTVLLLDVDVGTRAQTVVGQVWDGTVTLDEASAFEGAAVSGHAEGTLYAPPTP
jgi:hypothetical protein